MSPETLKAIPRQKHFYECAEGHGLGSPRPEKSCRARPHGKPCQGTLRKLK